MDSPSTKFRWTRIADLILDTENPPTYAALAPYLALLPDGDDQPVFRAALKKAIRGQHTAAAFNAALAEYPPAAAALAALLSGQKLHGVCAASAKLGVTPVTLTNRADEVPHVQTFSGKLAFLQGDLDEIGALPRKRKQYKACPCCGRMITRHTKASMAKSQVRTLAKTLPPWEVLSEVVRGGTEYPDAVWLVTDTLKLNKAQADEMEANYE